MVLLKNRIIKHGTFLFCFIIAVLTSFNLFSQENKMNSEEKHKERLEKHQALKLAEKDSIYSLKEHNFSDSVKTTSASKNDNSALIDPSFPIFIDTGNPENDHVDYRKRKDQWIKENPESYKKMHTSESLTEEQKREMELKRHLRLNNQ